ncbi:MAG: DUF6868 family protein [Aeoliella sp.]
MNRENLNSIANIFGVCFLLCAGLMFFVMAMFMLLHDWAYGIHSYLFILTPEAFDMAVYQFLAQIKALGLVLFLIPWVALKFAARRAT